MKFTNPRLHAEFTDWPLGGNKRGSCVFHVENGGKKGFRVGRTTTGKTKFHTYHRQCAIVDGDNGKTYILQLALNFDFVTISRSDFKNAEAKEVGKASVFPGDEQYQELRDLLTQANTPALMS